MRLLREQEKAAAATTELVGSVEQEDAVRSAELVESYCM